MPNLDLQRLFDLDYLFSRYVPAQFEFRDLLIKLLLAITFVSILLLFVSFVALGSKHQRVVQRHLRAAAQAYLIVSILGLLLIFCRTQSISLFSMRIWLLIILLMHVGMIGYYAYQWLVEFPKQQTLYKKELVRQQYLPKSKKKK